MSYDTDAYGWQSNYSTIVDEGAMAHEDGVLREELPYAPNTPEAKCWLQGWDADQRGAAA